ncbi:MAG: cysteine peptidase family C39 domain-containing protein [Enterobacterales bacterium]|nr:cysteine peptidase family C39 domain-containing protein [Enterobacterales bacterium]
MKWLAACLLFMACHSQAYNTTVKGWVRLRTEGVVRQTTDFSCGPAALSLLLKTRFAVELKEIDIISDIIYRAEPGTEAEKLQNGFSLLDLKNSAQRMGFHAKGLRYDVDGPLSIKQPVLIPLEGERYSHFVVLVAIRNVTADILDPEVGRITMPLWQLKSQWKGYALQTDGLIKR